MYNWIWPICSPSSLSWLRRSLWLLRSCHRKENQSICSDLIYILLNYFLLFIDHFFIFVLPELWGLFTGACRRLCRRNGPLTLQCGPELWGRPSWHCCFCSPLSVYVCVSAEQSASVSVCVQWFCLPAIDLPCHSQPQDVQHHLWWVHSLHKKSHCIKIQDVRPSVVNSQQQATCEKGFFFLNVGYAAIFHPLSRLISQFRKKMKAASQNHILSGMSVNMFISFINTKC